MPAKVIRTPSEYRAAMDRANALRDACLSPEDDRELAELDGAIARYTRIPGEPATSEGRPEYTPEGDEDGEPGK